MGRGRATKTLALVEAAREILEEIQPATVRAVAYQLFVRGLIDSMAKVSTNRVSTVLVRAREEGTIPWEWIVQEGRAVEQLPTWRDPAAFARTIMRAYRRNKWAGQPKRIMVVAEKGTVRGTLERVLDELEVPFLPVGGYASATRAWELAGLGSEQQPMLLLYLGDWDPSGLGMSELDLPRRLARYASADPSDRDWTAEEIEEFLPRAGLELRRIALTEADTADLGDRLGFPVTDKEADPRYDWFCSVYGERCWELDALNPNILRSRVQGAILAEVDRGSWERYVRAEVQEQARARTRPGLAHQPL